MGYVLEFDANASSGERAWQSAVVSLIWLVYLISLLLFWKHRKLPYLASRVPFFSLTFGGAIFVNASLDISFLTLWDPLFYCEASNGATKYVFYVIGNNAFLLVFASVIWRLCVLIEKFEAQRIRLAIRLREEGFEAPFENNFFQRNLGWLTSWPVIAALVVYVILPPFVSLALGIGTAFSVHDNGRCWSSDDVILFAYVIGAIAVILLSFKFRTVQDGFSIVKELKQLGILAIYYVVTDQIFMNLAVNWAGSASNLLYITVVIDGACFGIVIIYPLYCALAPATTAGKYQRLGTAITAGLGRVSRVKSNIPSGGQPKPAGAGGSVRRPSTSSVGAHAGAAPPALTNPTVNELKTLEDVLRSIPGRRSFEKHLMLEFSIESLLFLDEVNELRSNPDTIRVEVARAKATAIYSKFVSKHTATHEINISSLHAKALHKIFAPSGIAVSPNGSAAARPDSLAKAARQLPSVGAAIAVAAPAARDSPTNHGQNGGGGGGSGTSTPVHRIPTATTPTVMTSSPLAASTAIIASAPPRPRFAANTPLAATDERKLSGPVHGADATAAAVSSTRQPAARIAFDRPSSPHATIAVADADRTAPFYLSVFDSAYEEVLHSLKTDSFARYTSSQLYDELLRNVAVATAIATNVEIEALPARVARQNTSQLKAPLGMEASRVSRVSRMMSAPGGSPLATAADGKSSPKVVTPHHNHTLSIPLVPSSSGGLSVTVPGASAVTSPVGGSAASPTLSGTATVVTATVSTPTGAAARAAAAAP